MAQVTSTLRIHSIATAAGLLLAFATSSAFAQDTAPPAGLDQQAREAAWAGRTGEGIRLMDAYLATHPDDRAARLDRARFLAWSGDYAAAIEALDAIAPDSPEAQALRARIYAWAGRRNASLALNAAAYGADPADYDAAYTQALAARQGEWPHEALPALEAAEAAKPDGKDTRDLARAVRLPLFSSVALPVSVYRDSDDIEIRSVGLQADVRVGDPWRLLAEVTSREISAPIDGPWRPVTGGDSVDERRVLVGARYAFSPDAALEVELGRSDIDPGDGETVGHIEFGQQASDAFGWRVRAERDRVLSSPLAVSLGVLREGVTLSGNWRPTLRDNLRGNATFEHLTDDNHRTALDLDYRHAVVRNGRLNLDIGGQAEWQSYSRNPGDGYYSPDRYERIAPLASAYVKLGDDAGLFLQGALGVQRDETFDSWKRAADFSAQFTFGIFSHWQLVASVGYSQRLNQFGRYEGRSVGLELRYRFCEARRERCPANAGP
ncbi:tetratricopeptide repeat protein [Cognatilysobacter segetis]|uniref:tetratricopeptide repeat protein n=1 Tax=Cognatilysobacter segetis TaxID=2492394 RepID=UPI003CCCE355